MTAHAMSVAEVEAAAQLGRPILLADGQLGRLAGFRSRQVVVHVYRGEAVVQVVMLPAERVRRLNSGGLVQMRPDGSIPALRATGKAP